MSCVDERGLVWQVHLTRMFETTAVVRGTSKQIKLTNVISCMTHGRRFIEFDMFCMLLLLPVQACGFGKGTAPPHGRNRKCLCSRNHRWRRWSCIGRSWWPPCGWPPALMTWRAQLLCRWGESLQRHKKRGGAMRFYADCSLITATGKSQLTGTSQVSIVLNMTESYMVQQESWTMVTKFTNVVGFFLIIYLNIYASII